MGTGPKCTMCQAGTSQCKSTHVPTTAKSCHKGDKELVGGHAAATVCCSRLNFKNKQKLLWAQAGDMSLTRPLRCVPKGCWPSLRPRMGGSQCWGVL